MDISDKLKKAWSYSLPTPTPQDLYVYLSRPLDEQEKIPIPQSAFDKLLAPLSGDVTINTLTAEQLSTLFRISSEEYAESITFMFSFTIQRAPDSTGTEDFFHSTYDRNISDIIRTILPDARSFRNTNKGTSTALQRPDYVLLMNQNCIFRGEEKGSETVGNPKEELVQKIVRWQWDPLNYILGLL